MSQDGESRALSMLNTRSVPVQGTSKGLYDPGAGTVSPWGTHLGLEASAPAAGDGSFQSRYLLADTFNAYRYGYVFESKITVTTSPVTAVTVETKKSFTMGRRNNGGVHVMPDLKTVYMTDTAPQSVLTKFVAAQKENLHEGVLFCAQLGNDANGVRTVTWVDMGSATSDQIEKAIQYNDGANNIKELNYGDFFGAGDTLRTDIDTTQYGPANDRTSASILASRFETRRYSLQMGCTPMDDVRDITFSESHNELYISVNKEGGNDCGCVYALTVDNTYGANDMKKLMCGVPVTADDQGYTCDRNAIAGPDNIMMSDDHNQLFIAEASENIITANNPQPLAGR